MHDIKKLGNQQLGLHYEVIYKKLNDMKIDIMEDITDILGKVPGMDVETYTNHQKFHEFCSEYLSSIQEEKKNALLALLMQEKTIQQEIERRQKQMLKDIGIDTPSLRTKLIAEKTKGSYFPVFDEMIRYIKLAKTNQIDKRPDKKRIYVPPKLIGMFEKLGTTPLTVIANNMGPMQS